MQSSSEPGHVHDAGRREIPQQVRFCWYGRVQLPVACPCRSNVAFDLADLALYLGSTFILSSSMLIQIAHVVGWVAVLRGIDRNSVFLGRTLID